jgi:beta-phosphoglucomutase-like phosphatase (HAD superfamily)
MKIPGLGEVGEDQRGDLTDLSEGGDGLWRVGRDGVLRILAPRDGKVEFAVFRERTLAYVRSSMGYPAIYPLSEARFEPPAEAVLMDLDGTSVRSEEFWIGIIERTTARLLGAPGFRLEASDAPCVSGHSVSEHLQYCIGKYCPGAGVEDARGVYLEIARNEMAEILAGGGRAEAFRPAPGLKDFLLTLKDRGVRIGLVTSGLHEKAWPEIVSAFRTLGLGDPRDFYDAIITAGTHPGGGQVGTLGELESKPHPWLYAETARVGLGIDPSRRHKVVGLEDSGAGVVSLRLAGFAAIGVDGGNLVESGVRPLVMAQCDGLAGALALILGT